MSKPSLLRNVKSKALAWVKAKDALESFVNGCAINGKPVEPIRMAELTRAYNGAEHDLELAVKACGEE